MRTITKGIVLLPLLLVGRVPQDRNSSRPLDSCPGIVRVSDVDVSGGGDRNIGSTLCPRGALVANTTPHEVEGVRKVGRADVQVNV